MNKQTISMTAQQLRKLLDSVPQSEGVFKTITPNKVQVHATRKKTGVSELVIEAVKNGTQWDVTAPVGLIKAN